MDDEELLKSLAEAIARQRGYAGYFDWIDEHQKDLGLLAEFEEGARALGLVVSSGRVQDRGKDPPDAWLEHDGFPVAVEFTEFVDQGLIQKRLRTKEFQWRFWTRIEFKTKCDEIIQRKDHAGFGAGRRYWLVIHCDEPALNLATVSNYLEGLEAFPVKGVDRCFLLLSYEPGTRSCPLLELAVTRSV